jgi:hypothetical protein
MRVLGSVASILYLSACGGQAPCELAYGTYEATVGLTSDVIEVDGVPAAGCSSRWQEYEDDGQCHYRQTTTCPDYWSVLEIREVSTGYWIGTVTTESGTDHVILRRLQRHD